MHKTRIGHVRVEIVLTDEMRQKLMELATGNAAVVEIPQTLLQQVKIHHYESNASRLREAHFRQVAVDRLELVSAHANLHIGM